MKHTLPELPFPKDALLPQMSPETLEFHHGKHHRAYVDKLNELIQGTPFENKSLDEIVRHSSGPIFNNAAQHWNHSFFWQCLKPNPASPGVNHAPTGDLAKQLELVYGSFNDFKQEFTKTAVSLFGSGWAWLVKNKFGHVEVLGMQNAGNPLTEGYVPLMTCDVWEHAYYIDYRNARPKFVEAFWTLANWDFAASRFSGQTTDSLQKSA